MSHVDILMFNGRIHHACRRQRYATFFCRQVTHFVQLANARALFYLLYFILSLCFKEGFALHRMEQNIVLFLVAFTPSTYIYIFLFLSFTK